MKKPSQMGSSKYEFDPQQLDKDIQKNLERYKNKKGFIETKLNELLWYDACRYDETWTLILEVLREIKIKGAITNKKESK